MINKKNKKALFNIGQFVDDAKQNIRSVSFPISENAPEKEGKNLVNTDTGVPPGHTEAAPVPDPKEPEEGRAEEAESVSGEEASAPEPSDEKAKRSRRVKTAVTAVKRDKLIALRFDKKMHKEISRIKLEYEIDIQDFVYVAVERFKEEFFPNGKATREGLDIISKALDRINGKTEDE